MPLLQRERRLAFPEKAKRLWVGLAGPYFELVLWSVATLVWRLTEVDTGIHSMALMVMTSSGVKALLNFNPLIKLDGYYLLSDYLEIPNLRSKAFRCIGAWLKRLLGWGPGPQEAVTPRERSICWVYGLAASVFSCSLLAVVASKLGGYFVESNQPLGMVFCAGLLAMKSQRWLRRWFGKTGSLPTGDEAEAEVLNTSSSPRPEPQAEAEATGPARPRKRKRSGWQRRTVALALVSLAVTGLLLSPMELKVSGPFNVLPVHNADARTEVEGIVAQICVEEGSRVQKGDSIAHLSDREIRAEWRKTEAEIEATQANLRKLQIGPTVEEIDVGRAAVSKARDHLAYAERRLARDKTLHEQNLLSRKEFGFFRDFRGGIDWGF